MLTEESTEHAVALQLAQGLFDDGRLLDDELALHQPAWLLLSHLVLGLEAAEEQVEGLALLQLGCGRPIAQVSVAVVLSLSRAMVQRRFLQMVAVQLLDDLPLLLVAHLSRCPINRIRREQGQLTYLVRGLLDDLLVDGLPERVWLVGHLELLARVEVGADHVVEGEDAPLATK